MEVVLPSYPRPDLQPDTQGINSPPADPSYPSASHRVNRSSSSPSTMEEEEEGDLEEGEEEDGLGEKGGGERRDLPTEEESEGRRNRNDLNENSQKTSGCYFLLLGDARELGTPIIEQLLSRSASSSPGIRTSQTPAQQIHNHNHNHNMEKGQDPESDDSIEQDVRSEEKSEQLRDGGSPTNVEDLASQLFQLQGLVKDMRDGLTSAMEALTHLTPESALEEKVNANKAAHDQQLADVLHMVLALKGEFSVLNGQLAVANETQQQLRGQVDVLQYERDILLEELETYGVVSENVRQKYHSGRKRPNGLTRANDSTLSVLLERARTVFNPNNGNSDQDSGVNTGHQGDTSTCGEVTPPNISPMVQSYIAGLPHENHVDAPMDEHYDSDSSITAAANKSLDMSRSLGDKCAELTNVSSSDDEDEEDRRDTKMSEHRKHAQNAPSVCFKRPASPKRTPPHEKSAKELARSRVGREILETERKYCSCLWTILDHFSNPLRESNILASKEMSIMFPACLTRIYEHHCAFLQKLEERVANWRWHSVIGDVFSAFIDSSDYDVLVQYRSYVNEFPAALNQLKKSCRHSLRFRKFLRKCQQDPVCEGLDLAAFLLTPVQRIPRYVLLLKEMLKYTLPEHIDYYYVEACLAKLGTFLTQLNDSIEYSMKVVTNDTTPKTKRKLRVGSMRSSSSSNDGGQLMTPRDSGIQSAGDNTSILSTSSNGRMFQLSLLKENQSDRPLGVPDPDTLRHSFMGEPPYDTRTMPAMGTRRQRERSRRPKSGDVRGNLEASHNMTSGDMGDDDDAKFVAPQQPPPRTRSFAESTSSQAKKSVTLQQGLALGRQLPVSGVSPFRVTSPHDQGTPASAMRASVSMKDLPEGGDGCRVVYSAGANNPSHSTPYANTALHKSMSHLPAPRFGVFGSEEGEEEPENGGFNPSQPDAAAAQRRAIKLAHRSRSQGHLTFANQFQQEDGSNSSYISGPPGGSSSSTVTYTPSQPRINLALARSLTDDPAQQPQADQPTPANNRGVLQRPRSCLLPSAGRSSPASGLVSPGAVSLDPAGTGSLMSGMRPRAASLTHGSAVTPVSPGKASDRPREHVWNDSSPSVNDTSTLSVSDLTMGGRRKDVGAGRKKKKDKQQKDSSLVTDSARKKTGIKDSLKNIFFKKRKTDKEKIALQDVLAEDTEVTATSIKYPLRDQTSLLNIIRPGSARSSPRGANQGTLVVRNGQITLEQPGDGEDGGKELSGRLKKRPHSVCYGAVTCTPQEKKSSLKMGPSRSSLGSKVVEIGPGLDHSVATSEADQSTSFTGLRQTAPPTDDSLIVTSRHGATQPDFATYEDENGDPCSAV